MAKITKTVVLHRHTYKDASGKHVTPEGLALANRVGHNYNEKVVDHVFFGRLIRTTETAIGMMIDRHGFDKAVIHDIIDGLGCNNLFGRMVTDDVKTAMKTKSVFEAVMQHSTPEALEEFKTEITKALSDMFALMEDGQLGVGVFHDPTISMLASYFGLEDARSLEPMESITFRFYDDGIITASWK